MLATDANDDPVMQVHVPVDIVVVEDINELIRSSLGIESVPAGMQPAAGRLVPTIPTVEKPA